VAGACKCGDETSGSIKCGEFLNRAFQQGLCYMKLVDWLFGWLVWYGLV
jgi:hypothetical protein